jgi:RNA polymerase sigma factor (TIGR02999 family)
VTSEPPEEITRLLEEVAEGRSRAADRLMPLVYTELRRLARSRLHRDRAGHSLQATALVHEVYVRLVGDPEYRWANRAHFFAAAAEAMRRIVIERVRHHARLKRGGDLRRVSLDEDAARIEPRSDELLALDDALSRLEEKDAPMAHVVKLRYFVGLTIEETARALETSTSTVNRLWIAAKTWLHGEIAGGSDRA